MSLVIFKVKQFIDTVFTSTFPVPTISPYFLLRQLNWKELLTTDQGVEGSSPLRSANSLVQFSWLERAPDKREVGGSSPPTSTICALGSGGRAADL